MYLVVAGQAGSPLLSQIEGSTNLVRTLGLRHALAGPHGGCEVYSSVLSLKKLETTMRTISARVAPATTEMVTCEPELCDATKPNATCGAV
jgi:hypothetical protein